MIRYVFNLLCGTFFKLLFICKSQINNNKSLYIFDIDNTIGNTYPTLTFQYQSDTERLLSIPFFPQMKNLLNSLLKSPSRKVIFLTSRSYLNWDTTHQWLTQNGILAAKSDIIIVSSPAQKIDFINKILPRNKPVTVIDDLSYNHENGQVKFYDTEIQLISGLSLRYIGYKTILRFNSKNSKWRSFYIVM